jgi:hypothetical protein
MIEFLFGCLCGIGMTVGIFLFLTRMAQIEPWEDPLLPSNYNPPKKV